MPRIALCPAPAQERQKILAVAAVPEFFNSLLVIEHRDEYQSETAALTAIAGKLGCSPDSVRVWLRQAQSRWRREPARCRSAPKNARDRFRIRAGPLPRHRRRRDAPPRLSNRMERVIAAPASMACVMSRYAEISVASLAASRFESEAAIAGRGSVACACARLRACSSSRSMLNSSARIGASSPGGWRVPPQRMCARLGNIAL